MNFLRGEKRAKRVGKTDTDLQENYDKSNYLYD